MFYSFPSLLDSYSISIKIIAKPQLSNILRLFSFFAFSFSSMESYQGKNGSKILRQLRVELMLDFPIVRKPLVVPYLLQIRYEFLQRRKRGGCHKNRLHCNLVDETRVRMTTLGRAMPFREAMGETDVANFLPPLRGSAPIVFVTRGFRSSFQDSLTPACNPPPLSRLACQCRMPAKVVTPRVAHSQS